MVGLGRRMVVVVVDTAAAVGIAAAVTDIEPGVVVGAAAAFEGPYTNNHKINGVLQT